MFYFLVSFCLGTNLQCSKTVNIESKANTVISYDVLLEENLIYCYRFHKRHQKFAFAINKGDLLQYTISEDKHIKNINESNFVSFKNYPGYYFDENSNYATIMFKSSQKEEITFTIASASSKQCSTFGVSTFSNLNLTIKAKNYCFANLDNTKFKDISITKSSDSKITLNNHLILQNSTQIHYISSFFYIKRGRKIDEDNINKLIIHEEENHNQKHLLEEINNINHFSNFNLNQSQYLISRNVLEGEENNDDDTLIPGLSNGLSIAIIVLVVYFGIVLLEIIILITIGCIYPNRLWQAGWTCPWLYCCCSPCYGKNFLKYIKTFYTYHVHPNWSLSPFEKICCCSSKTYLIKPMSVQKYPYNCIPNPETYYTSPELFETREEYIRHSHEPESVIQQYDVDHPNLSSTPNANDDGNNNTAIAIGVTAGTAVAAFGVAGAAYSYSSGKCCCCRVSGSNFGNNCSTYYGTNCTNLSNCECECNCDDCFCPDCCGDSRACPNFGSGNMGDCLAIIFAVIFIILIAIVLVICVFILTFMIFYAIWTMWYCCRCSEQEEDEKAFELANFKRPPQRCFTIPDPNENDNASKQNNIYPPPIKKPSSTQNQSKTPYEEEVPQNISNPQYPNEIANNSNDNVYIPYPEDQAPYINGQSAKENHNDNADNPYGEL